MNRYVGDMSSKLELNLCTLRAFNIRQSAVEYRIRQIHAIDGSATEVNMAAFLVVAMIVLCYILGVLTSKPGLPVR